MADQNELFAVADAMRARGERVSVRRLMRGLPNGGSPRDVTRLLRAWRAERDYRLRIEEAPVPEFLRDSLERFVKEVWEAACAEADARAAETAAVAISKAQDEQALADEVIDLAERNAERADELARRNEELIGTIAALEKRLRKVEADEFWDRVMRQIWEILPADGSVRSVEEIEPLIGRDLVQESSDHREKWTLGTLRKKMNVRVHFTNYFERDDEGLYRRLRR